MLAKLVMYSSQNYAGTLDSGLSVRPKTGIARLYNYCCLFERCFICVVIQGYLPKLEIDLHEINSSTFGMWTEISPIIFE